MLEFGLGFIVGIGILCLVLRYLARNKSFFVMFPSEDVAYRLRRLNDINPQSEINHLRDAVAIYLHFAENPSYVTKDLSVWIGSITIDKWKEYHDPDKKKKAFEKEVAQLKKKYGID